MIPESIRAEIEQHGGIASVEGPDANGITTYRAVDGTYVNVGSDGRPRMRGFAPPQGGAAPNASAAPAAGQAAPRGAGMTQAELEALLAQMGALGPEDFREEVKNEDAPNPRYDGSDITVPPTIKQAVTYRTWVKPGTSQRLTVKVNPDGTYTQAFSGADPNIKPSTTTPTKPTNVYIGTNPTTGKPSQVSEYPDPSQPGGVRREYDDTQVPAGASGSAQPPPEKDEGGTRYQWQPNPGGPSAGGKWVPVGTAPETPAERQAREANAPTQTVRSETVNGQTYTVITIVPKPGQPGQPGQIVLGPDGKPASGGIPGKAPTPATRPVDVNGIRYTEITTSKPDGSVSISYLGPDGKPVAALPSEGAATAGGPKMPNFVLHASEQALTDYWNALQNDPNLTPAQRTAHFGQAVQIAQIKNQEWATLEGKRQSEANMQYNIATGKADYLQKGAQEALKFASGLKGTDLGGKVFAAMLGLNLAILQSSGIDSLTGQPKAADDRISRLPTITPADMRSPQAIDAKRAQIDQAITPSLAAPPSFMTPGAPAAAAAAAAAVPVTPSAPAPAAAPAGAIPAPPAVGVNPDAGQALGPTGDSPPLNTAPPVPVTAPQAQDFATRGINPATGEPIVDSDVARPGDPGYVDQAPIMAPQPSQQVPAVQAPTPAQTYPPGQFPGGNVLPQPSPPSQYGGGQDTPIGQQPWQQFPAIAAMAPAPTPAPTPVSGAAFAGSPAIRLAQIEATPSWLLDEATYKWAVDNGAEDKFWSIPGARVV